MNNGVAEIIGEVTGTSSITGGWASFIFLSLALILCLIFTAIAGVYNAKCSANIKELPGYDKDTDSLLLTAAKSSDWAAATNWIVFSLVIISIIIYLIVYFRSAGKLGGGKWVVAILLFISIIALFIAFYLSVNAFTNITNSKGQDLPDSRRAAVQTNYVATIVEAFAFGFLSVAIVASFIC